jgi:site-specific DNA-cytosine methylase
MINVLSIFDGMSGAQLALQRAGIEVANYYAVEIDKYAIKVTQANFPNTIQLGDINNWREWNLPKIDLIIGGSPCQGFSAAGKHLNFDDPRSKLFFTFAEIIKTLKPTYWLMENVKMRKDYQEKISEYLGVQPVAINSALVSAQNRQRLYWANFPITQPEDKGLVLRDIIESGEVDKDKAYALDASYYKGGSSDCLKRLYYDKHRRQVVIEGAAMRGRYNEEGKAVQQIEDNGTEKSNALTTVQKDNLLKVYALTEARTEEAKRIRKEHREQTGEDWSPRRGKELVPRTDGKANCLTTGLTKEHIVCIRAGTAGDVAGHDYNKRIYSQEGKAPTLAAKSGGNLEPKVAIDEVYYRKLTPLECERLQTVEDGYTNHVSNTQRYKMLGNGFTINVISHILKDMVNAEQGNDKTHRQQAG